MHLLLVPLLFSGGLNRDARKQDTDETEDSFVEGDADADSDTDADGDGQPDVLIVGGGDRQGRLNGVVSLDVGDTDGDGVNELAIHTSSFQGQDRAAYLLLPATSTGVVDQGEIGDALLLPPQHDPRYDLSAAGDLNGDGYDDLAYVLPDEPGVGVVYGPVRGATDRRAARDLALGINDLRLDHGVNLPSRGADIDGDGLHDLVVRDLAIHATEDNDDETASFYVAQAPLEGLCSLDHVPRVEAGWPGAFNLVGDVDGDTRPDLAAVAPSPGVWNAVYLLPLDPFPPAAP